MFRIASSPLLKIAEENIYKEKYLLHRQMSEWWCVSYKIYH